MMVNENGDLANDQLHASIFRISSLYFNSFHSITLTITNIMVAEQKLY